MAESVMIRCLFLLRSKVQAGLHLGLLRAPYHLEALLRQAWHHASMEMILWIATTDLTDEMGNGKADFRILQLHHLTLKQNDEYGLTTML